MKFRDVPLDTPALHLICGMPGGGKTVLSVDIAVALHKKTGKPIYIAVGRDQRGLPEKRPDYIHQLSDSESFPLDSIVLIDDAHLKVHARRAMSDENVEMDQMHGQLRHDKTDFILDTQTLKGLDVNNILRSNYRWYKKPYDLDVRLGRREIVEEMELAKSLNLKRDEAYLVAETFDHSFKATITDVPLPSFWTDEWSTMHRRRDPSMGEQARKTLRRIF